MVRPKVHQRRGTKGAPAGKGPLLVEAAMLSDPAGGIVLQLNAFLHLETACPFQSNSPSAALLSGLSCRTALCFLEARPWESAGIVYEHRT